MQKKILEFTNILRKSGIRVSTAEAIDAFHSLDLLSIDEAETPPEMPNLGPTTGGDSCSTTSSP